MKLSEIARIRLFNQGLSEKKFTTLADCLNRMGAIQAQDFNMAKWALGIRTKDATETTVTNAFNAGTILRTHLLRPTWHFVSSANIYWLLSLNAARIRASMKSRDKQLELTEKIFIKSNNVIERLFKTKLQLTREEIISALNKAKIQTDDNRAAHLLINSELNGLICSGAASGTKQTYALLENRVQKPDKIDRDEALIKLAKLYFKSHGPATMQDFTWWSGLSPADSKLAIAALKKDFSSVKIGEQTFFCDGNISIPESKKPSLHLLPAFDELLISYKDRTPIITQENHAKAISSNGIFNPTIAYNGHAIGTWKRKTDHEKISLEPVFFIGQNARIKNLVRKAALDYAYYMHKKVEINF